MAQARSILNVISRNLTIKKADPSLIFDSLLAGDTDFWMGVVDDAGSDDDDTFQIGDGTTPGVNPFLTFDTSGNVGIGTVAPGFKLEVVGTAKLSDTLTIAATGGAYGIDVSSIGDITVRALGRLRNVIWAETSGTLTANNTYAVIQAIRGTSLGGFTASGAVLQLWDRVPSTGNILEWGTGDPYSGLGIIDKDGKVGIGTTAPTNILSFGGNSPRTFWVERHTTANTAGNSLTIQSGGATAGATDKDGGDSIILPGISTGTGRNRVRIQGHTTSTSTGTADNSVIDLAVFNGFKALVNNTNTSLVNCTIANNSAVAGVIRYAVEVFDGTDIQIEEGVVSYHATNKAGTVANNTTVKFGNQQAVTAGTLTVTWTITAANPSVLTINANSSLTPSAGYPRVRYVVENLTSQIIAIQ